MAMFTIACFLSVSFLQCFTLIHSFIHHSNYTHNLRNWQHNLVPHLKKAACYQIPLSESWIHSTSSQPTLWSILILSSPPTLSVVPKHSHIAGHLNIMVSVVLFVKQKENWFFYTIIWTRHNMVSYHIRTWLNERFYIRVREKCKIQQP